MIVRVEDGCRIEGEILAGKRAARVIRTSVEKMVSERIAFPIAWAED